MTAPPPLYMSHHVGLSVQNQMTSCRNYVRANYTHLHNREYQDNHIQEK